MGGTTTRGRVSEQTARLTEPQYVLPFVLITSLFFLWAFGVNLNDILIPHLKKAFRLTDFRLGLRYWSTNYHECQDGE